MHMTWRPERRCKTCGCQWEPAMPPRLKLVLSVVFLLLCLGFMLISFIVFVASGRTGEILVRYLSIGAMFICLSGVAFCVRGYSDATRQLGGPRTSDQLNSAPKIGMFTYLMPGVIAGLILHFCGAYENGHLQTSKPLALGALIITSFIWMRVRPWGRKMVVIIVTALVYGLIHQMK